MTSIIINDTVPYTQVISSPGQTQYDTDWTADEAANVQVYARLNGVAPNDVTQLVSPSLYTVSFVSAEDFVRVTFLTGRTNLEVITITRTTPVDRENLYTNTNFTPSMLNSDFGLFTLQMQERDLYNTQLTPRYNTSATIEPVVDTILPILAANQFWVKNGTNTGFTTAEAGAAGTGNVGPGLANQLAYYPADGTTVTGIVLETVNNGVFVTDNSGVPKVSITLPNGLIADNMKLAQLLDINDNVILETEPNADAVNYVLIGNSATTDSPYIGANGTDANIALNINGKGTSGINLFGFTDGSNAPLGAIGEVVSNSATGVALVSGTPKTIALITLSPGDWDVYTTAAFTPAASTTVTNLVISANTTTNTLPSSAIALNTCYVQHIDTFTTGAYQQMVGYPFRVSVSVTTPYYLVVESAFAVSTMTAEGLIWARRAR